MTDWEGLIETALVDRLKTALAPLPVEPLPDKQWNFTHPKGSALVMWSGGDPEKTVDTQIPAQPVTLSYEVLLLSRSLRDGTGLYPMWTATRTALLGWKPLPGLLPLSLARVRPQGYEDGAWRLVCTWSTQAMYVADDAGDIGPLLKKLEFEEI